MVQGDDLDSEVYKFYNSYGRDEKENKFYVLVKFKGGLHGVGLNDHYVFNLKLIFFCPSKPDLTLSNESPIVLVYQ